MVSFVEADDFGHEEIQLEVNSIYITKLLNGPDGSEITCELEQYALQAARHTMPFDIRGDPQVITNESVVMETILDPT